MILIKLQGGLGNQLFQYALGRHLAIKNRDELVMDIKDISAYKYGARQYSLSHFNVSGRMAEAKDLETFNQNIFNKVLDSIKPYYKRKIVREKYFDFDQNVLSTEPPVYISGFSYWRSEKYFKDIESTIKDDLTLKTVPEGKYEEVLRDIQSANSVSLHVRRTDYLLPKHAKIFTQCTERYYEDAIKLIKDNASNIKIFVFSDDINRVKDNLNLPKETVYVSENNFADYEDLTLMSVCKHNITANSTFSWWGAWLNNNPDKIVITPKKWFVDQNNKEKDLIPETWIKI